MKKLFPLATIISAIVLIFTCIGTAQSGFDTAVVGLSDIGWAPHNNASRRDGRARLTNHSPAGAAHAFPAVDAAAVSAAVPNSGDLDLGFNPSFISDNANVEMIVPLADGKILVGGSFTSYNGTARQNLAKLNANGSIDTSFAAEVSGAVSGIAIQPDGKILIGGAFTSVNGVARGKVARLNADGTLDVSFSGGVGADLVVYDVKLQPDGKVMVGGTFTTFHGTPRSRIARLNVDGSLDTSFDPGAGPNNTINKLALQADGKMMIAGLFDQISGTTRRQLARLNANGTLDTSFSFNQINLLGGVGRDVVIQPDGKILAAGFFQDPFQQIILLIRLNPNGTTDTSFQMILDETIDDHIEQVALQGDGKVVVGGFFSFNSTSVIRRLSRLNSNGTIDTSFNPGSSTNSSVEAVAVQADGKVLAGGPFTTYQGTPRSRMTRTNTDGSNDASFDMGTGFVREEPGVIYTTLVQPDGKILIGGLFQRVNGVTRNNIARLNADGTLDTSFNPGTGTQFVPGGTYPVYTIALESDGQIVIGGLFPTYNNQFVDNIARLQPNGSLDTNFNAYSDGAIRKIVIQPNGHMLVGGDFDYMNDFPRPHITRIDDIGEVDFDFNDNDGNPNSAANSNVYDIALQADGKILIGGQFTTYNSVTRNRIARLMADGLLDTTFAPNGGANATVWSVTPLQDGKVLITGTFTEVNGQPRNGVARLNADGSLDMTFTPQAGANGAVYDLLLLSNGKLLIGGEFTTFNNSPHNSLARLNSNGTLDDTYASGTNGYVRSITAYPDDRAIIGGFFTSVNGVPRSRVARLHPLTTTSQRRTPFDFDGDAKTDLSIFRPSVGQWWINRSSTAATAAFAFGASTDALAPADFTGDGKTDVAFFRPSTGSWFVLRSEDSSFYSFPFGANGDVPIPADFDADGKADAAVYRPSANTWFINKSTGGTDIIGFGSAGDIPVVADYDGDAKADIAIYRPTGSSGAGEWWVRRSSNSSVFALVFGTSTDRTVAGDYTGDGKADLAFFRPSNGNWFILRSEDFSFFSFPFGANGDTPVPGDYDGDGKNDAAVFRPSSSTWFANRSSGGTLIQAFGASGDIPLPSAYVR